MNLSKFVRNVKKISRAIEKYGEASKKNNKVRKEQTNNRTLRDVDSMSGIEFENFCGNLFMNQGYQVSGTKTSNDYGADLVLHKNGKKIVVQVKRYSNNIGVSAVQEIVSAKAVYKATEAWVITNQYYTRNAKNLAEANNVLLLDRDSVVQLMRA